jgi:hypothetical protein
MAFKKLQDPVPDGAKHIVTCGRLIDDLGCKLEHYGNNGCERCLLHCDLNPIAHIRDCYAEIDRLTQESNEQKAIMERLTSEVR